MIQITDVQIPAWLRPKMGPADQERVRREALRIILNEKREEALGADWREKYSCWELQLAEEVASDFLLELEIRHIEEAEKKASAAAPAETPAAEVPTTTTP